VRTYSLHSMKQVRHPTRRSQAERHLRNLQISYIQLFVVARGLYTVSKIFVKHVTMRVLKNKPE